jgi:hypothetical protein
MDVPPRTIIAALYAQGHGPTVIARRLNADRVPTPSGRGHWYPETVHRHMHPDAWNAYMRDYLRRRRATLRRP